MVVSVNPGGARNSIRPTGFYSSELRRYVTVHLLSLVSLSIEGSQRKTV